MKIDDFPHVPAAFINAIAEEGSKKEAIEHLQAQWNESCYLRAKLAASEAERERLLSLLDETRTFLKTYQRSNVNWHNDRPTWDFITEKIDPALSASPPAQPPASEAFAGLAAAHRVAKNDLEVAAQKQHGQPAPSRDAVLEEAARKADELAWTNQNTQYLGPELNCTRVATAIRALKQGGQG